MKIEITNNTEKDLSIENYDGETLLASLLVPIDGLTLIDTDTSESDNAKNLLLDGLTDALANIIKSENKFLSVEINGVEIDIATYRAVVEKWKLGVANTDISYSEREYGAWFDMKTNVLHGYNPFFMAFASVQMNVAE